MRSRGWRVFGALLGVLGAWMLAAPYVGPPLGFIVVTRPIVEVVDHVVPGAIVLGVAALAVTMGRLAAPAAVAGLLAGMWATGTHAPLLLQTRTGGVDLVSALWHALPGAIVFVATTAATVVVWPQQSRRSAS